MRCAHVLRDDGGKQQVSREVTRTVSKGTVHGGPNPLGCWVVTCQKKRMPDQRRLRACLRDMEILKRGQKNERSGHRVREKDCVGPPKIQSAEVDNDVIEIASVSLDSDVVLCCPSTDSLAPFGLLTDTGCTCVPCCPQRFVSQF